MRALQNRNQHTILITFAYCTWSQEDVILNGLINAMALTYRRMFYAMRLLSGHAILLWDRWCAAEACLHKTQAKLSSDLFKRQSNLLIASGNKRLNIQINKIFCSLSHACSNIYFYFLLSVNLSTVLIIFWRQFRLNND